MHHQHRGLSIWNHPPELQLQRKQRQRRLRSYNHHRQRLRQQLQQQWRRCVRHAMGKLRHLRLVLPAQQHPFGYHKRESRDWKLGTADRGFQWREFVQHRLFLC